MPKSIEIRVVVLSDQDVRRLHVAVHQPDPVGGEQRRPDLLDDPDGPGWVERATEEHRFQIFALDEPHAHEQASIDLAEIVNRHHMGVVEPRRCPSLPAEPLLERPIVGEMSGQDLHRHHPVGHRVVGAPYVTHSAATLQRDQSVPPERRALQVGLPDDCG